jgi:MarR family transcriptional regulator for hemolysin
MESNVPVLAVARRLALAGDADVCATLLLDVVPGVMKAIRMEMRSSQAPDLSLAQFRSLWCLSANRGQSLSELADSIGLALPSMSKLIDGLISRGLVRRTPDKSDRRRIMLRPTERGEKILKAARETTRRHLAEQIAGLDPADLQAVARAMEVLRPVFSPWLDGA